MPAISAVLTAHREGLLLGPSVASLSDAVSHARSAGLEVEVIIVLDRADELTRECCAAAAASDHRVICSQEGDPGQARMVGVHGASGDYVTFLDGDDLWGFNWLTAAYDFAQAADIPTILHSEANAVFGHGSPHFWWHVDSTSPEFDVDYLRVANYWDALSFARRDTYLRYPFRANALSAGYGHEDWHWNCLTLEAGFAHRPVPNTVHFKRKRPNSQMALCERSDVVPWPTHLVRYDWPGPATCP